MSGWSSEMHAIHDEIEERILFRDPEINALDPDTIIATRRARAERPAPVVRPPRRVKIRQCCHTPKSEGHADKCFNNPKNWRRP